MKDPVDFVVSAAALRLGFERRLEILRSAHESEDSRFVVYAVDSDIVKLFTSPSSMGPPGQRPNDGGYGKIFPSDDDASSTAIATVLAEYIFFELSDFPVLQLAPHATETLSILNGISRNLSRPIDLKGKISQLLDIEQRTLVNEILVSDKDQIKKLSDLLVQFRRLPAKEFEAVSENILLVLLVKKHKLQHELVRFLTLYSRQKLVSTQGFSRILGEGKSRPGVAELFDDPKGISDWFFISEKTEFWKPILVEYKSSEHKLHQIGRDANALAYLDFFNRKLASVGGRMILISGDQTMTKAVHDRDTGELYSNIIHPRSFLIEALETATDNASGKRPLRHSLDLLLMEYTDTRDIISDDLRKLVNKESELIERLELRIADTENQNWELYTGIVDEWEDQKAQIMTSRMLSIDSNYDLIVSLIGRSKTQSKHEIEAALKLVQERLEADNIRQWTELSLSFSKAGMSILFALRGGRKPEKLRSRNPPAILFDRFTAAGLLVSKLLETNDIENLVPSLTDLIEGIKNDVSDPRLGQLHQNYLTFLAFSVLSAAEGKWYIARVLAEIALGQANILYTNNPSDPVTGREALFILSQATRLLAKERFDVDKSECLLKKAIQRFDHECSLKYSGGQGSLTELKGIRFDAEQVSIILTKAHFAQWLNIGEINNSEFLSIPERITHLTNRLNVLESKSDKALRYRDIFGAYVFVNSMQFQHLVEIVQLEIEQPFESIQFKLWESFGKRIRSFENTIFHTTYLMRSYQFYFENRFENLNNKKIIQEHFESSQIEKYSIMKYDKRRFSDLAQRLIL